MTNNDSPAAILLVSRITRDGVAPVKTLKFGCLADPVDRRATFSDGPRVLRVDGMDMCSPVTALLPRL